MPEIIKIQTDKKTIDVGKGRVVKDVEKLRRKINKRSNSKVYFVTKETKDERKP